MKHLSSHWKTPLARTVHLFAMVLLTILAGCVQQYPISYYASPGDTVVLGLGGIQRNSGASNSLSASDLTITLTNNSTSQVTTLQPKAAFKTFPDYSSTLNVNDINGAYPLIPFDGGWFVPVQLPTSGLPVGAYTISITSPTKKLDNTKYCGSPNASSTCEGDLENIPLQIVNDNNSAVSSSYAFQFSAYAAATNRLDVSPNTTPDSLGYSIVGGLQLTITFPAANYNATLPVMAVPYSHHPSIQLSQNIIDNGNGTKSLLVFLSAPQGFVVKGSRTALTPVLSDLSLSFLFFPSGSAPSSTQVLADFSNMSGNYYDINGTAIPASVLYPVMTYQN